MASVTASKKPMRGPCRGLVCRRISFSFLLLALFFSLAARPGRAQSGSGWELQILESDAQHLLVELTITDFTVETLVQKGVSYQRLTVPGWGRWGQPGQPGVPAYHLPVGMPWPGTPQVLIVETETETRLNYYLYPKPDLAAGGTPENPELVEIFKLDAEAYQRDTTYPGSLVEVAENGFLRQQPLFQLGLYPFQYNPVTRELAVTRRMKVLVTFPTAPLAVAPAEIASIPLTFRQMLQQTLINYEALPIASAPAPSSSGGLQAAGASTATYLIITHPSFYTAVQELATYRAGQGESVAVIRSTDIYNQYSSGVKSPDAIKNFLIDTYVAGQGKLEYVLLVGDADARASLVGPAPNYEIIGYDPNISTDYLPTHYEKTPVFFFEVGPTPLDAWYAKVQGDDDYPDIIIGRIPARSASDVTTVINKVKAYEQSPLPGDWARRAVLVADDSSTFTADMDNFATFLPGRISPTKMYDYDPSTSVQDEIRSGVLLLAYSGHGNDQGWSWWDKVRIYQKSYISNMSNGNKLPFVVAANCSNGYFAAPSPARVFGEEFLLISNKGAVAVWTTAAYSFPSINKPMIRKLPEVLFANNEQTLGSTATTTLLQNLLDPENAHLQRNLFEIFTFFGDPATRFYVPATLTLDGQGDNNQVVAGNPLNYVLNYTVSGAARARGLTLINTLPEQVTFQSASVPPSLVNGQILTWNLGDVPQGNYSLTISVVVNNQGLNNGQIISDQARLFDINSGDKTVKINTQVMTNDIPPQANFYVEGGPKKLRDLPVNFKDLSTGTSLSYQWNFGDGQTSNAKNPSHIYTEAGFYNITLTVNNSLGSDSKTILVEIIAPGDNPVQELPAASFISTSPDELGETTSFINTSYDGLDGQVSYTWNFGDGQTSSEKDPLYTYQTAGIYTVQLTVTNTLGAHTFSDIVVIKQTPSNTGSQYTFLPVMLK